MILSNPLTRFVSTKKDSKNSVPSKAETNSKKKFSSDDQDESPVIKPTKDLPFKVGQCKPEVVNDPSDNPIHISDMMYFDAIKRLREELYRIPIDLD